MIYMQRVNLSIAIVAMTTPPRDQDGNFTLGADTDDDYDFYPHIPVNLNIPKMHFPVNFSKNAIP